jgi:hypothetical protein
MRSKLRNSALLVITLVFFGCSLHATSQYTDYIFYKNKKYPLYNNPMEPYFEENPEERPKNIYPTTALHRGYIATFEIKNFKLMLKDIEIQPIDLKRPNVVEWKSIKSQFVSSGNNLQISWFSGILSLPFGEKVKERTTFGYDHIYSLYYLVEVANGSVNRIKSFNLSELDLLKNKMFTKFSKTTEYNELLNNYLKYRKDKHKFDNGLQERILYYMKTILIEDKGA